MALEGRERTELQNFAKSGLVDQAVVAEFVGMVPESKRTQIAETLSALVMRGEQMQYSGTLLTPATMAAIALAL